MVVVRFLCGGGESLQLHKHGQPVENHCYRIENFLRGGELDRK